MPDNYTTDKTFESVDFSIHPLAQAEYDSCTFVNCNFANTDFYGCKFIECTFTDCNLSMVKTSKTTFRDAKFIGCKIIGWHFEECDQFIFSVAFEKCMLTLSSFYKMKMKKQRFQSCTMHEVDFTEADLSAAVFEQCDLLGTKFENTNLEKADFRTAYNYSLDPELNKMKKAKFSMMGLSGLLDKYNIEIEN